MTRDFLEIDELSHAELAGMLDTMVAWKQDPARVPAVLAGQGVALVFQKPSARTRNSAEMAVVGLGGHPVSIRPDEISIDGRESAEDVARTLASYHAILAARVFDHGVLERMAEVVDVPVVNLLSDRAHPCQTLADLLTIREELGALEGTRVAYVGDGNNVTASLAFGAALTGVELIVSSPAGYELDDGVLDRARNLGGVIDVVGDPHPQGRREGEALLPGVDWMDDPYAAAEQADALVILTEWNEFRALDLGRLARTMATPRMADLRNVYGAADALAAGFEAYVAVGRPAPEARRIGAVQADARLG